MRQAIRKGEKVESATHLNRKQFHNASSYDSRNSGALQNSSWNGWVLTKDGWTWAEWCKWRS